MQIRLNRKLVESPFTKELDQKKYFTYLRNVKKNIDLFREANIPLQAELNVDAATVWCDRRENDGGSKRPGIYIATSC